MAHGHFFPQRPFTISAEFEGGKVGSAALWHARSTLGLNVGHGELYTGFDYQRIDDVDLPLGLLGFRL